MTIIDYTEIKPAKGQLMPYIESYVCIKLNAQEITSKEILPRPGATLLFVNNPVCINEEITGTGLILGIHNRTSFIKWNPINSGQAFVVKFSPYGLSRFLNVSSDQIANTSIFSNRCWGDSINRLHNHLFKTANASEQIALIEYFLTNKFIAPTEIEKYIFQLADDIRTSNDAIRLNYLLKKVPLSHRQIERKFKELIGVNIQTYIRICHFENAKSILMKQQSVNLTDIGYQSGYFDQAHFSREFKRFTKYSPRIFFQQAPFYKVISELKS